MSNFKSNPNPNAKIQNFVICLPAEASAQAGILKLI
jgi:hypothetical protein